MLILNLTALTSYAFLNISCLHFGFLESAGQELAAVKGCLSEEVSLSDHIFVPNLKGAVVCACGCITHKHMCIFTFIKGKLTHIQNSKGMSTVLCVGELIICHAS